MTPRILLVEGSQDGTTGGSHRSLGDLARLLRQRGFDTGTVFYEDNTIAAELRGLGVPTLIWADDPVGPGRPSRVPALASGRRQLIRTRSRWRFLTSQDISLVHLNNAPTLGYDDWLPAARLARIPCITHMRGDCTAFMPHDPIGRHLVRSFDRVIAISEHVADAAEGIGVPRRRIELVYNGIDLAAWRASVRLSPAAVREALGIAPEAFVVVMVGNLREWKGQHVLLEALARLPDATRAGLRVLFVGDVARADQPYAERLRRRAEAPQLAPVVTFLGVRSDVADLMNASDLVVHASVDPEPFGRVLLEAMALGKPVLAPRLGGPVEVLGRFCESLFEPGSPEDLAAQLCRIRADATWAAALGAQARQHAETFDVSRTVERMASIYRRLLPARA